MSAKRKVIHCGHEAVEAVSCFPFYVCTEKQCTGKPALACPKCKSANVEAFSAPPVVPPGSFHCWGCGHCFHPGF